MGNRMSTGISSQGASALWTQALCPRQWQTKGGLTLTCQKTRCQTHSDGKAECTTVNEQLVAVSRNDQAEAVTLKHQAAEITGDKKHCVHCQEGLIRRTSVLFLVVYSPVIFLQSHKDTEEGKAPEEGNSKILSGLLESSNPTGNVLEQALENPNLSPNSVTSYVNLGKSLNLSEPQVSSLGK